ncbi:MAG TPA: hypothetical protein PLY25_11015 [Bacteroidia bacterium]|nr:hypothetical protein [Saprospiraceae bacterium]HQW47027.1 hypothetical protein [Chitinophagaceae bacterium]HRC16201.1 hypothetical protein [Bacteroidia bacterium]
MEDLKTQIIQAQISVIGALRMLNSEMKKVNKSDAVIKHWEKQVDIRSRKLEKLASELHNLINNPVWI